MYYLDKDKITRYNCQNIKTMTAEIEVMSPIDVYFDICAVPPDRVIELYPASAESGNDFGKNENGEYDSYIEITLDDSVMYVNSDLKEVIANIFKKYFDRTNCVIGQLVDYSVILNEIYGINGISNVRTIFVPDSSNLNARIINGLSFASWSANMIDYGEDMQVSNVSRQLEDFQFPVLYDSESISSKIKIIKKQLTNINTIKY